MAILLNKVTAVVTTAVVSGVAGISNPATPPIAAPDAMPIAEPTGPPTRIPMVPPASAPVSIAPVTATTLELPLSMVLHNWEFHTFQPAKMAKHTQNQLKFENVY